MAKPFENLISVADAARQLGCSIGTAYQWIRNGELPATRIGKAGVILSLADVEAFAKLPRPKRGRKPKLPAEEK